MRAVDQRIVRQCCQSIERSAHLSRRALEQAAAASAEQGIAAKQRARNVVGDMASRMAADRQHCDMLAQNVYHFAP